MEARVRPAMGSVGDANDNAMCESFFATLERELRQRCKFKTEAEARMAIFVFIEGWQCSAAAVGGAFAACIAGNVASNLVGRLMSAAVADTFGLASNFYFFASLNLAGAAIACLTISAGMRSPEADDGAASPPAAWRAHLANPALRASFAIGFCILFAFIGVFTFVNFVLVDPPFDLGMMRLGLVYLVFLPSLVTTPLAGASSAATGRARPWPARSPSPASACRS
jgi:hypothetical protein